ncbi:MAG: hypothetical protein LBL38_02400 [Lactobacillales bacterium]|jgi:hypothetical protein|nr:hypothetical protein [Lactobacillales bacterium]
MLKIDTKEIPKLELELHASYLLKTIHDYFEDPQVQKDYKIWLKGYKKRFQSTKLGDK